MYLTRMCMGGLIYGGRDGETDRQTSKRVWNKRVGKMAHRETDWKAGIAGGNEMRAQT